MKQAITTIPVDLMPGSWLSILLGLVLVLGQEFEQAGVVRADQYAVPIQGVFADDAGEAGSGLVAGVCADDLADGAGQGLAGAAGYVVVNTRLGLHHGPGSFVNLLDQLRLESVSRGIPQIYRVPRVRRVIRVIRVRINSASSGFYYLVLHGFDTSPIMHLIFSLYALSVRR